MSRLQPNGNTPRAGVEVDAIRCPTGISPLTDIELRYADSARQAEEFLHEGFEPVECSFGHESIVGALGLDHHANRSDEEPVSLKAARLASDPDFVRQKKFVVAGSPDPDAVYTILALSKALEPNLVVAAAIAELDLDPIGIDRSREPYIRNPAFEMSGPFVPSTEGFVAALEAGQATFQSYGLEGSLISRALVYEERRIVRAREAVVRQDGEVILVASDEPSRDVWHQIAPLFVQWKPSSGILTVSGCTAKGANRVGGSRSVFDLLGAEGLNNFYSTMDEILGTGSGGRPDIGGSPRSRVVTRDEAERVFEAMREQSRRN